MLVRKYKYNWQIVFGLFQFECSRWCRRIFVYWCRNAQLLFWHHIVCNAIQFAFTQKLDKWSCHWNKLKTIKKRQDQKQCNECQESLSLKFIRYLHYLWLICALNLNLALRHPAGDAQIRSTWQFNCLEQ